MKLTKLIERIVEARLNEAFKSDLMRQLNSYYIPNIGWKDHIYDGYQIVKLLTALGISASEITDDQMFTSNSGGVTYSKNNPTDAVIIVDRKYVQAVLYGERHVKLYGYASNYGGSNGKFMQTTANIRQGRQGKADKTGWSSLEAIPDSRLNNMKFFAIKNAKIVQNAGYNKDYAESLEQVQMALYRNRARYAEKIKEMRAAKRADSEFPDEIINFANELLLVGSKMKDAFAAAIDNPKDRSFASNRVTSSGHGKNSKSYYTPYLQIYQNSYKYITDLETAYKSGKDYTKEFEYNLVKSNLKELKSKFN